MNKILLTTLLTAYGFTTQAQDNPLWMRHPAVSPDGKTIAFTKTEKFLKCTREQYIKQRNKFDSMTGDERVRLAEERLTAATGKKQKIITLDKGGAETNKITTPKRIHIEKE